MVIFFLESTVEETEPTAPKDVAADQALLAQRLSPLKSSGLILSDDGEAFREDIEVVMIAAEKHCLGAGWSMGQIRSSMSKLRQALNTTIHSGFLSTTVVSHAPTPWSKH